MIRVWVDSSTRGDTHTVKVMLTGTDRDVIHLIDELNLVIDGNPSIAALHDMLCDRTGLVAKEWPPPIMIRNATPRD